MANEMSRRSFLKKGAAAAIGMSVAPNVILGKEFGAAPAPSTDKLKILGVGIGGRGASVLRGLESENIIGLCDVDWNYADHVFKRYPNAKKYNDYRRMFDDMLDQIPAQMQEYQEIIERRQQLEERMAEQRAEQERLDREIAEKFGMDDYMELDDLDPSDMIGGDDDNETPIPFESAGDADGMAAPSSWDMSDIDSMIDEASDGRLKGNEYSLDSLDDVEPQDGSDGFADIDTGIGDGGFLDDVPTPSQSAGGGFSIGQAASVPDIVSSYQHQPGESAFGDDPFADADDRYADDAEPDATGDGGESLDPFADFADVAELEGDGSSEELSYSPSQSEVSGMFGDVDDVDQPSDVPDVSDLFGDADDGYDQPQYDDGQNGYDDAGDVGVDDFDDDDIGKLINSAAMSI